ncbi:MAG: TerB family tellurite resistance protein [Notoacmeibacter sp.]
MADSLLKSLKSFFTGNAAVRKVADDPALTAELLLLFRVMLTDGQVLETEQTAFERICQTAFGIEPDDVGKVTDYLRDFGYETTGRQAIEMFADVTPERRLLLIEHMREIANADAQFLPEERKLIDKVAELLGV